MNRSLRPCRWEERCKHAAAVRHERKGWGKTRCFFLFVPFSSIDRQESTRSWYHVLRMLFNPLVSLISESTQSTLQPWRVMEPKGERYGDCCRAFPSGRTAGSGLLCSELVVLPDFVFLPINIPPATVLNTEYDRPQLLYCRFDAKTSTVIVTGENLQSRGAQNLHRGWGMTMIMKSILTTTQDSCEVFATIPLHPHEETGKLQLSCGNFSNT